MEFFKIRRTIPFMRHAKVFNIISLITFILAVLFVTLRIIYIAMYVGGMAMVRSAVWAVALLVNIGILLIAVR